MCHDSGQLFPTWDKADPLAIITTKKLKEFVYRVIVCKYGIHSKHIYDNMKQFDSKKMEEFCDKLGIKKDFLTLCHPQSNSS